MTDEVADIEDRYEFRQKLDRLIELTERVVELHEHKVTLLEKLIQTFSAPDHVDEPHYPLIGDDPEPYQVPPMIDEPEGEGIPISDEEMAELGLLLPGFITNPPLDPELPGEYLPHAFVSSGSGYEWEACDSCGLTSKARAHGEWDSKLPTQKEMNEMAERYIPHEHKCPIDGKLEGCEDKYCAKPTLALCGNPICKSVWDNGTLHSWATADGILPCCGLNRNSTPPGDRMIVDPTKVTCKGAAAGATPSSVAD